MLGMAVADVTPALGIALGGWGVDRFAASVHAPLEVRALALSRDALTAVIVTVDVLGLSSSLCAEIRARAERELGIPAASIMLASSHTHSAPVLAPWLPAGVTPPDAAFVAMLVERILGVVEAATAGTEPVAVGFGSGICDLGVSRRLPWDNGKVSFPPHADPGGPTDPEVGVLRFDALDGEPRAVLFSYGCHPTVAGPTTWLGPDYPGAARRVIEDRLPPAVAAFVLGNCGDVRANYTNPDGSFLWEGTEELVEAAGERVGVVAAAVAEGIRTRPGAALSTGRSVRSIHTMDDRLLEESEFLAFTLGDAAIVSNPAECFCEIGLEVRAAVDVPILFASVTNGFFGYVPTRAAYPYGGYEVEDSWRSFGLSAPVREDSHAAFRDGMLAALANARS